MSSRDNQMEELARPAKQGRELGPAMYDNSVGKRAKTADTSQAAGLAKVNPRHAQVSGSFQAPEKGGERKGDLQQKLNIWETAAGQCFGPDQFQSYLNRLGSPHGNQMTTKGDKDPQHEQQVDFSKMSLSQYSRQIMRSQLQNRKKTKMGEQRSPVTKTMFGTGISKNLYALYLRKYGKSDKQSFEAGTKHASERISQKPTRAFSEHGGTLRSEQSPSEHVQKSTIAGSSQNERVRNKKEGVLVSKDEFQIARRQINLQKLKDQQELRGSNRRRATILSERADQLKSSRDQQDFLSETQPSKEGRNLQQSHHLSGLSNYNAQWLAGPLPGARKLNTQHMIHRKQINYNKDMPTNKVTANDLNNLEFDVPVASRYRRAQLAFRDSLGGPESSFQQQAVTLGSGVFMKDDQAFVQSHAPPRRPNAYRTQPDGHVNEYRVGSAPTDSNYRALAKSFRLEDRAGQANQSQLGRAGRAQNDKADDATDIAQEQTTQSFLTSGSQALKRPIQLDPLSSKTNANLDQQTGQQPDPFPQAPPMGTTALQKGELCKISEYETQVNSQRDVAENRRRALAGRKSLLTAPDAFLADAVAKREGTAALTAKILQQQRQDAEASGESGLIPKDQKQDDDEARVGSDLLRKHQRIAPVFGQMELLQSNQSCWLSQLVNAPRERASNPQLITEEQLIENLRAQSGVPTGANSPWIVHERAMVDDFLGRLEAEPGSQSYAGRHGIQSLRQTFLMNKYSNNVGTRLVGRKYILGDDRHAARRKSAASVTQQNSVAAPSGSAQGKLELDASYGSQSFLFATGDEDGKDEEMLSNLKLKQEQKLKIMKEQLERQKRSKLEAIQRAKEEERKEFLLDRQVPNILRIVDKQLKEKDLLLDGAIRHDMETCLAEYLKTDEEKEKFLKEAKKYIWGRYVMLKQKRDRDKRHNNECIIDEVKARRKGYKRELSSTEPFNMDLATLTNSSSPKHSPTLRQKNRSASRHETTKSLKGTVSGSSRAVANAQSPKQKSEAFQQNAPAKKAGAPSKQFLVDICCHDQERADQLLDIYEKYRWEWSFEMGMKLKKPRKIQRTECLRSALKQVEDEQLRLQLADPLTYMYKIIKNELKELAINGADPREDQMPRTWTAEPLIEQPVIDRASTTFSKFVQNPSVNYICESKNANDLVEKVSKMKFDHRVAKPEEELEGLEEFEHADGSAQAQTIEAYWKEILEKRLYAAQEYKFGVDLEEYQAQLAKMNEKQRSEFLQEELRKEKDFDDALRRFIDKANRIDRGEDDTGDYTSIVSPDSRAGNSPTKRKRNLGSKKDAISKIRMAVKAVMQENAYKYKINNEFAGKHDFFQYLKKESKNHYVEETNTVFKIFQDLYFESYYGHHATPMPAFTFLQDQALIINEYPLSAGQASGLSGIFQRYSHHFNNENRITAIDLFNCSLTDESFANILKGLRHLHFISQIVYQRNEFKEKSAAAFVEMVEAGAGKGDQRKNLTSISLISVKTNAKSMQMFFEGLAVNQQLRKLRVSDIDLSDKKVFAAVTSALDNFQALQLIDLSQCNLALPQLDQLVKGIEFHLQLEHINISYNYIRRRDDQEEQLKLFLESVGQIIVTNLRLIHLNMQGMNLRSEILIIIEKLRQSRSLNAAHLSDNEVPLTDLKIAYEKMGLPHLFKYYFKSPEEAETSTSISETTEFRDVKRALLQQEFDALGQEDEQTRVEQNACFMVNCYHLKQLNSSIFRQRHLEQEVHRGLQHQRALVHDKPLFFCREFAHREHKIFEVVKENLQDYPNPARWAAPIDQRCYICERHVSIQIFFNPSTADREWSKITDQKHKEYLLKAYNLRNTEFKTPMIFGSLISNDDRRQLATMPMVYTAHYALSFILHADYFKPSHTEMRREIITHIKTACVERHDPLGHLQTGQPRPNRGNEPAQEKRKRRDQVQTIAKFDPLNVLTRASKLDPKKTLGDVIKEGAAQDQDEIQQFNFPKREPRAARKDSTSLTTGPRMSEWRGRYKKNLSLVVPPTVMSELPESYVYAAMAPPGMHLVLVYDPVAGELYKKLIAVQLKQKSKEFFPQRLDVDFTTGKVGDLTPRAELPEKEMFPIKISDVKTDATFCFDQDVAQPEFRSFKSFKSFKDQEPLLHCARYLHENYATFCMAYLFFMQNQIGAKLALNEGQDPVELSPDMLKQGISLSGLWEYFGPILENKLSRESFEKMFSKSSRARSPDPTEDEPATAVSIGTRAEFVDFLVKLALKSWAEWKRSQQHQKQSPKKQDKEPAEQPAAPNQWRQRLAVGIQKQVDQQRQAIEKEAQKAKKPMPVDYLIKFGESFESLLNTAKVTPLNIIKPHSEDSPVNPDTVDVIRVVLETNMKLLHERYEALSRCAPEEGIFEAKYTIKSAHRMVSELLQPSALDPKELVLLFNQARYLPVHAEKLHAYTYESLQFEEFLVFVAQLVARFANLDHKTKAKLPEFVTSERAVLDKIVREERKDERKGFVLKVVTVLRYVIGDRSGGVKEPAEPTPS